MSLRLKERPFLMSTFVAMRNGDSSSVSLLGFIDLIPVGMCMYMCGHVLLLQGSF